MGKKLTETQLKLRDAGIQMKLALENDADEDIFRSCINSFIIAARSVTMLMEKESAESPHLLEWYKAQTAKWCNFSLFKFFNDQRVHTVHRGVVKPACNALKMSEMSIVQNADGISVDKIVVKISDHIGPFVEGDVFSIVPPDKIVYWYFPEARKYFPTGTVNVVKVCGNYFIVLKEFVRLWLIMRHRLNLS